MQTPQTPEQFRAPEAKTYYNQHNYARFIFDLRADEKSAARVKPIEFANYTYITDDKREIEQLDAVADYPGTMIYTKKDSPVAAAIAQEVDQETQKMVSAAADAKDAELGVQGNKGKPIVPAFVPQNASRAIVGMQSAGSDALANLQRLEQAK